MRRGGGLQRHRLVERADHGDDHRSADDVAIDLDAAGIVDDHHDRHVDHRVDNDVAVDDDHQHHDAAADHDDA
ncbi:MAG: zinc ABC transporter substrate-binding protein, partial [Ilumatobacteraceae bacterium]